MSLENDIPGISLGNCTTWFQPLHVVVVKPAGMAGDSLASILSALDVVAEDRTVRVFAFGMPEAGRVAVAHSRIATDASGDWQSMMRATLASNALMLFIAADAVPARFAIHELLITLENDPMFGFVVPRTNVESSWSAPIPSFEAMEIVRPLLRPSGQWQFVPTVTGQCVLVRDVLVQDLAEFDSGESSQINGAYFTVLERFSLHINRLGYRTVVSNDSYVETIARPAAALTATDDSIRAEQLYRLGSEPRFEAHVAYLASRPQDYRSLLVDLTGFRHVHNGTTECTRAIITAIIGAAPTFELHLLCDADIARFHRIADIAPNATIHAPDTTHIFDASLRIGFPFEFGEVARLSNLARSNIYMALDSIAWDCAYVRPRQLDAVWRLIAETADAILFNSLFTRELFRERFWVPPHTRVHVSPHSFDVRDYQKGHDAGDASQQPGDTILIIGNHFDHKYVMPTLNRLVAAMPEQQFTAVGLSTHPSDRVRALASGSLDQDQMRALYAASSAVVVPSHYEGFGFSLAHGLAAGRPVLARDTRLTRDFRDRWNGYDGLHLYRTTDELIALLASDLSTNVMATSGQTHETWGWAESGRDITEFVRATIDPMDGAHLSERLARIAQINAIATVAASRAASAGGTLAGITQTLRRLPGVRQIARRLRRR